ncbi:MAG: hypothetical protein Q9167_004035 [Letrouitia subvulpina]
MATDVSDFMQEHGLGTAALIGHSMGAKVAMTLALRSPNLVRSLIPVDNAPVRTKLGPEFYTYIRGLQAIETANVTRQVDADRILKDYEDVSHDK